MEEPKITESAQIESFGKIETPVPTRLEDIFGRNDLQRYGTLDEDEYRSRLSEMNRPELETEARRNSVMILEQTPRLVEALAKEFLFFKQSLARTIAPQKPKNIHISEETRRILAEGK